MNQGYARNKSEHFFFRLITAYRNLLMVLLFIFCTVTAWADTENNRNRLQARFTGGGVSSAAVQGAGAEVSATGLKGNVSYRGFFFL